jgi:hypothetical protein
LPPSLDSWVSTKGDWRTVRAEVFEVIPGKGFVYRMVRYGELNMHSWGASNSTVNMSRGKFSKSVERTGLRPISYGNSKLQFSSMVFVSSGRMSVELGCSLAFDMLEFAG